MMAKEEILKGKKNFFKLAEKVRKVIPYRLNKLACGLVRKINLLHRFMRFAINGKKDDDQMKLFQRLIFMCQQRRKFYFTLISR